MEIEKLTEMKDWELMWEAQKAEDVGALLVFKRSPTCPVSHAAEREFRSFIGGLPASKDLRVVSVDVIEQRPISQRIAKDTAIRHESPQALLISRGQNIIFNESHGEITAEILEKALIQAKI